MQELDPVREEALRQAVNAAPRDHTEDIGATVARAEAFERFLKGEESSVLTN